MDIHIGDDITVSGRVTLVYDRLHVLIKCEGSGEEYFIDVRDVKTIRPNRKETQCET